MKATPLLRHTAIATLWHRCHISYKLHACVVVLLLLLLLLFRFCFSSWRTRLSRSAVRTYVRLWPSCVACQQAKRRPRSLAVSSHWRISDQLGGGGLACVCAHSFTNSPANAFQCPQCPFVSSYFCVLYVWLCERTQGGRVKTKTNAFTWQWRSTMYVKRRVADSAALSAKAIWQAL